MRTKDLEVDLLQVNDLVIIYPGEGIPVDGVLVFGKGICNESMLTGESKPIHKDIGSMIYGGSILIQG
jgi:P-type E1-E2 ATPase